MTTHTPILACALGLTLASAATAQPAPEWNRRAEALAIYADPADPDGPLNMYIVWSIGSSNLTAPVDLTTELTFDVDGTVFDILTIPASANPNFNECLDGNDCGDGDCGDGDYGGDSVYFSCITEDIIQGITDCACKKLSPPEHPDLPLAAPGVYSCSLAATAGSAGETNTSDDTLVIEYQGEPIYWARGIESISATQVPGAPDGVVDLEVHGYTEWHGQSNPLPLDCVVELRDENGTLLDSVTVPGFAKPGDDPLACGGGGCGSLCGFWNGLQVNCDASHMYGGFTCVCGGGWLAYFEEFDTNGYGGAITVVLRPAPGALPELPGFEEDDERRVGCIGDLNFDGKINQADLGILLASFGQDAGGDIDGDLDTDQADLGLLLSVYGTTCEPV